MGLKMPSRTMMILRDIPLWEFLLFLLERTPLRNVGLCFETWSFKELQLSVTQLGSHHLIEEMELNYYLVGI